MAAATTTAEWELCKEAVERRSGMAFDGPRARVLAEALAERSRVGGYPTVGAYFRQLFPRPDADPEWAKLFARLRNGDTRFFRDPPAFAALVGYALPDLRERRRQAGVERLSLWSAGCSTGQEAYSLAIACAVDPACAGAKIEVVGTDVNRDALVRAAAGVYRTHEAGSIRPEVARRFFEREGDSLRATAALRDAVRFRECELLGADPPFSPHDVIFCQNVLVYYRPAPRLELLRKLTRALAPGGYLFLGAAEAVGLPTPGLQLIRLPDTWIYRRAD